MEQTGLDSFTGAIEWRWRTKNNTVENTIVIGNVTNDIEVVENTITVDNTQSNTKLPQTGELDVAIAVLALALIAVVSYIQIKRNRDL